MKSYTAPFEFLAPGPCTLDRASFVLWGHRVDAQAPGEFSPTSWWIDTRLHPLGVELVLCRNRSTPHKTWIVPSVPAPSGGVGPITLFSTLVLEQVEAWPCRQSQEGSAGVGDSALGAWFAGPLSEAIPRWLLFEHPDRGWQLLEAHAAAKSPFPGVVEPDAAPGPPSGAPPPRCWRSCGTRSPRVADAR